MLFGVLKDIKEGENRVICTPVEVKSIVSAGHKVLVQKGAGVGAGFSDAAYEKAGKIHFENAYCRKDIGARAMAAYKK